MEVEKTDEKNLSNSFLGKKKYNNSNSNCSSSSNSFGFQISEKENEIIFEYKHITHHSEIDEKLSKINSPCSYEIKNPELLELISKEKNNQIKVSKSFFEDLKPEEVNFIDYNYTSKEYHKDKNRKILYFSSSILKNNDKNDNILFNKLHNYLTNYTGKSLISDFCFDKNLYFPFS